MGDLSCTQREILDAFCNVDFSLLPLYLAEIWRKANVEDCSISISELARFTRILDFYKEYETTFVERTPRSFKPRDELDLRVYMSRNSTSNFTPKDLSTLSSEQYFDRYEQTTLLTEYTEKANQMLQCQIAIHTHIWSQCEECIRAIFTFKKEKDEELNCPRDFISIDHNYERVRLSELFDRLTVEEQYKVVTDAWKSCLPDSSSVLFLIVIRMLFNTPLGASSSSRHPYLTARRANMNEIIRLILKQADGSDGTIRILSSTYSIVSGISSSELAGKCLIFKPRMR